MKSSKWPVTAAVCVLCAGLLTAQQPTFRSGVTLVTKANMEQSEVKDLLAPPLKQYLDE